MASANLKKAYQPSSKGYTLEIKLPACLAVSGPITQVIMETGAGHSMFAALAIYELVRSSTGWEVTRVSIVHGNGTGTKWGGEKPNGVMVARGTLKGSAVDDAIALSNLLLDVTLTEKAPKGSGGGWGSSGDFFNAVRLTGGGVVDRRFAGYEGSSEQMNYLPVRVAADQLASVIKDDALVASTFDAKARALFVARFLAESPSFDDEYHWWVREAYLGAAGDGGDATLLPRLHDYMKSSYSAASDGRSKVAAINAIAALSGDDRRFDKNGKARAVDDVAKDYAKKPALKKSTP